MKSKLILILTVLLVISICLPAFAQITTTGTDTGTGGQNSDGTVQVSGGFTNTTDNQTIAKKIISIYTGGAYIVGSLAALCLLGVGFMFIKSRGDERKLAEAKTWLGYIVIGIIVAACALLIIGFVIWLISQGGGATT